ncbi:MAG: MraY family glycosyltransferase [Bacilli bacterium]
MNLTVFGHNIFLVIITCFAASIAFVLLSIKISVYIGALDVPDERKIHKTPIPTLGGIGIFLSFLLGFMLFCPRNDLMFSILIASFLVLLLGIIDDIHPVPAKIKFLIHILISGIVVFYGGLELDYITIFGMYINFGFFAPFISMLIIVSIINAMNLIDGLDGLCAGISSIYFFTIAVIAIVLNRLGGLDIILSLIMLGSTWGFLMYNFPPAKVFMGDTGSTFLGLMISVITLLGFKTVTLTSLVIPLLVLAIPILDTLFAIIRRKLKGESIGKPDKEHIHHQILKKTSSKRKTLLIIYAVDIIFSITSIFYALGHTKEMIVCYVLLLFVLIFLILKTDIIFDNSGKRKRKEEKKVNK